MQSIQITGTYSFIDNIKKTKIEDQVKLIKNPDNRINKEAVGVYTMDNLKIGYIPFTSNQIDINAKYNIIKINLCQKNPILLIGCEYQETNILNVEPYFIRDLRVESVKFKVHNEQLKHDIDYFIKMLNRTNKILDYYITYYDENFVNLFIETEDYETIFYTVTKKYYDDNIMIYDEFNKLKLIPKNIYQQFQIHRLEKYLEINYKNITDILKSRKIKDYLKKNEIEYNETNLNYNYENEYNELNEEEKINIIKLMLQFNISNNKYYNPNSYLDLINKNIKIINDNNLNNYFNKLKLGGICYNHKLKSYCYIDLYNENNIIEISNNNLDSKYIMELIIKLIITNKNIINLYNPIKGIIYNIELPIHYKDAIYNIIVSLK